MGGTARKILPTLLLTVVGCGSIASSEDAGKDATAAADGRPVSDATLQTDADPGLDATVDANDPNSTCIMIGARPLRCTDNAVADYCANCLGLSGAVTHYTCSPEADPRSSCAAPDSCDSCSSYGSSGVFACVTSVECE